MNLLIAHPNQRTSNNDLSKQQKNIEESLKLYLDYYN